MNQHPTPDRLRHWLDGRTTEADSQEIEVHLADCTDVCPVILEAIASGTGPLLRNGVAPNASILPSLRGYKVLTVVGRGGMAIVYQARQVELGGLVALRMLLAEPH